MRGNAASQKGGTAAGRKEGDCEKWMNEGREREREGGKGREAARTLKEDMRQG